MALDGDLREIDSGWTVFIDLSAAALPSVRKQQEMLQVAAESINKPEISHNMLMRPLNRNYNDVLAQMRLESSLFLFLKTVELGFGTNMLFFFCLTGELSLEEFVAGARSDEVFMEVMVKSLDLAHIVAMIHNRRHSV